MADPAADYRSLPFQEAVDFFRGKMNLPTEKWTDIMRGQHARAFVVAGATKDELVADFRGAVDQAIADGTTLEEFRKDFDRIVEKHGWQYKGGRNWRSRTIFDTNVNTAYQAGRYKQMTDPEVLRYRPFWEYVHAVGERFPRPHHLAWDGTVLLADDPWWRAHYTPNGWGCKCRIRALSARDLKRRGKVGPDEAPPSPIDPKTGAPIGIDKGWDYNVGEAAWGRDWAKAVIDRGPVEELPGRRPPDYPWLPKKLEPKPAPAALAPIVHSEAELRAQLPTGIYPTVNGEQVNVTQAIVDHMLDDPRRLDGRNQYFPLIPDLLSNPSELWVGFVRYGDGKIGLLRRYVGAYDVGGKERIAGLVADVIDQQLTGITFFRGSDPAGGRLRQGRLVYPWPAGATEPPNV